MAPKLIRAFGEQQESTKESAIWILYMTVMSISNSLEVRIEIPSCSRISIDTDVNLNYLNLILANFLLHSLWSEPRISGNHCSMIIPRIKGFSFWEYGGSAPSSVSTWFQLYKKETSSYWIRKETCSDEDSTVKAFKRHLPTSIKPPESHSLVQGIPVQFLTVQTNKYTWIHGSSLQLERLLYCFKMDLVRSLFFFSQEWIWKTSLSQTFEVISHAYFATFLPIIIAIEFSEFGKP